MYDTSSPAAVPRTRIAAAGVSLIVALLFNFSASAAQARLGWTKVELTRFEGKGSAAPAALITAFGGETAGDYDTFAIATMPEAALQGFSRAARRQGIAVRQRDELNVLQFPNAVVDVRIGLAGAPPDDLVRAYPPQRPGLFVLQFIAPPRPEWAAELRSMGWQFARYLPENGYVAIGAPEMVAPTRQLSFIQWIDFYHPYQKYRALAPDGAARKLVFILPSGPGLDDALAAIRIAAVGEITMTRTALDVLVYATMSRGAAEKLLHHQLIIGVEPQPVLSLSDERQSVSLTVAPTETQPPSPRRSYWNWVTSQCPTCATMSHSEWKVGIVDQGLDNGSETGGHPDFTGRKYFGLRPTNNTKCTTLTPPLQPGCDHAYHGTAVASVAAGSASGSRPADGGGYFLGEGVAPRAGIFMTSSGFLNAIELEAWADDAVSNGVTIQNHSFNDYPTGAPDTSGTYTVNARRYDSLVRDAEDDPGPEENDIRTPLLLTVSAGNTNQPEWQGEFRHLVVSPGTAKNVISVSGTESVRGVSCDSCSSDSYHNIMTRSRIGTRMAAGYIKPDLVAPASAAVVALSTAIPDANSQGCQGIESSTEYLVRSGTSFAAPVAAGAALLVKRHLESSTPAATSPALTKAALIAGAQSIRNGLDRTRTPAQTIGAVPNDQQGFGRISLNDILSTPLPLHYDESVSRTFTQAGQRLVGRIRVRDGSKPVKVVLAWTDHPGSEGATNVLVNDLNLQVLPVGSPSTVYLGNRLSSTEIATSFDRSQPLTPDAVNNVEMSRFFGATNAEFDMAILSAAITGDTNGDTANWEQDFGLVVLNADEVTSLHWEAETPGAPQNFRATTNGSTVTLNWNAVANATYTVQFKNSFDDWTSLPAMSGTSTTHNPTSTSGVVLYRVRANVGSAQSGPSNHDVAFVGTFTDDPIATPPSRTSIKAVHIIELRRAVNGLRDIAQHGQVYVGNALVESELSGDPILASDFLSLLENLNAARGLPIASLPGVSFRAPAPDGGVVISRTHIEDLRNSFRTLP